jgi:hypothetical protein
MTKKENRKRRAMTSEAASKVKRSGHEVEAELAEMIGGIIYPGTSKRDVVDSKGKLHSVKSGEKKIQIFLYSRQRFEKSVGFIGAPFFVDIIESFPEKWQQYRGSERINSKETLKSKMRALRDFLSSSNPSYFIHNNKVIFLQEAIFHSSEVDFLTLKDKDGVFHIFDAREVIMTIDESTTLENSKAMQTDQTDDQKVVFKLKESGITIGEIEMRNDSVKHYRQVKFWMDVKKTLILLTEKINSKIEKSPRIRTYGRASRTFKF